MFNVSLKDRCGTASNDMNTFCSELFRSTPISMMACGQFSSMRTFSMVNSHPEFYEFYLNNKHYLTEFAHQTVDSLPQGVFFADSMSMSEEEKKLGVELRMRFGLKDFLTMIKKRGDGCEIFVFACDEDAKAVQDFYLNNTQMLERYVEVFREPLFDIFQENYIPVISVPECSQSDEVEQFYEHYPAEDVSKVIEKTARSKIAGRNVAQRHVRKISNLTDLTKREIECLSYIVKGFSAKQIAEQVSRSCRIILTVQTTNL